MRIVILLSLIVVALSAETRIKVGSKRWAFNIETNEGKNIRKEYTDENGVSHGTFSFVDTEEKPKQLQYKFDANREEPDISFTIISQSGEQENKDSASKDSASKDSASKDSASQDSASQDRASRDSASQDSASKDSARNDTASAMAIQEPNYESIDSKEEFSGQISLKVGKSVYLLNFITGDKTHAREEAFDENGMIYGKYTVFNEDKQTKVVVNYKFNSTGTDPTFEVSMYKKSERLKSEENEQNRNTYYDPNRVSRRFLLPSVRQYNSNVMPSVTLDSTNPPHNIITPMNGNWYYRVQ